MASRQDDEMSFGDFSSELSDLSSSEDDLPLAKTNGKGKGKAASTGYQIKDALRPPRTAQYTAKSLYDQIIENTIDLDPEYQRDVVWTEQKQTGIIDSILRNYYIPPVIFAVSSSDDGSELRTCIDGKQRLTSIQRFMDGLVRFTDKDSLTNQKLWYKQVGNTKRKLLPKQYMQQFAYKQITCVEYETISPDQEREIFQRVQLGVALTPAERMQAITGPWPTLIREIQQELLGESGFDGQLDWGHARGRDFQCLTSIVYLIDKPKAAIPGAQQLEKWLQETNPVPAKFRHEIFDTFRIFGTLVRKFGSTFHKPTKVAPVEFVIIGVLIHMYRLKLSLTQLSSAIEKMRADVRAKHIDIRQNNKVTKTMLDFIKKKIIVSELKSDQQGDKPASSKTSHTQSSTASKRKRAIYSEDSDESDMSKPRPSKLSTSRAVAGSNKAPVASSSSKVTKTPAKQASATKPPLKSAISTSYASTGPSKSSTIKPSVSTARVPKVPDALYRNSSPQSMSPQTMAPPSTQRRQSIPLPRPPSAPPSQPFIKREPSMPPTPSGVGPSDRRGSMHTTSSTSIHSPVMPGGFQPIHDPRRPPPQIQTNLDGTSHQQPSWPHSPVVGTPSFPPGTPLDQKPIGMLLARAGLSSQQNSSPQGQYFQQNAISPTGQQPLNGVMDGHLPSDTPPLTSHGPAFVQNPNNPLHSQSSGSLQSGYGGAAPPAPPTAPQALRTNIQRTVNGTGTTAPSQMRHSLPPRPSSATSSTAPHTSLPSTGSFSRYDDQYSRQHDRSRDHRDYDSSRVRGYDRDRDYGRHKNSGRSRERDGGWGSRGRGTGRASGSPTSMRYTYGMR
ncbi:hypothetical protein PILCRDRAFT_828156 [Piloderma croceum F 1598]|uniref:GmrSD restriction endonucleases N-terminal domain-containing protein n=1 Tax=Piloderma croceum (strain F 1598) TaxID=765440 RepID=A0A0C3EPG0_PILCF|nr:hypothetical protein PILCRDRAFT_828156 [Piloderma croceum F 1598]